MIIAEENKKYLRQSMDLSLQIAGREYGGIVYAYYNYPDMADELESYLPIVRLMDLANGGFKNDGNARPLEPEAPDGMKYATYAAEVCDEYGYLPTPMLIEALMESHVADLPNKATIIYSDSRGNKTKEVFPLSWVEDQTDHSHLASILFYEFKSNERLIIERFAFGEMFDFDNDSIVDCTLMLRGSNLDIESPTLEASEIEATVYVGMNKEAWDKLGRQEPQSIPLIFSCGYADDMTYPRKFYLSETTYNADSGIATLHGTDQTIPSIDGQTTQGYIVESTVGRARASYLISVIFDILQRVPFKIHGHPQTTPNATDANIWIGKGQKRDILARSLAIYRTSIFNVVYRDAGIPEVRIDVPAPEWELSEEEICELKIEPIKDIGEIDTTLYSASIATTYGEVANIKDAKNGEVYFIDSQEPIYDVRTTGASLVTPYTIKYTATADGDVSIEGRIINISQSAYYTDMKIDTGEGRTIELDPLPQVPYDDGSTTEYSLAVVGSGSRSKYSFKWRGNPHMQPQDTIKLTRTSDTGTYPDNLLYPSNSLYPDGTARVVALRILTVSYQFENGGLISEITALEVDDVD